METGNAQTRQLTQLFIYWASNLLLWLPYPKEKQGVPGRGKILYRHEGNNPGSFFAVLSIPATPEPWAYKVFCTIVADLITQGIVKFLLTLESFTLAPVFPREALLDSGWPREDIPLTDKGTEL